LSVDGVSVNIRVGNKLAASVGALALLGGRDIVEEVVSLVGRPTGIRAELRAGKGTTLSVDNRVRTTVLTSPALLIGWSVQAITVDVRVSNLGVASGGTQTLLRRWNIGKVLIAGTDSRTFIGAELRSTIGSRLGSQLVGRSTIVTRVTQVVITVGGRGESN